MPKQPRGFSAILPWRTLSQTSREDSDLFDSDQSIASTGELRVLLAAWREEMFGGYPKRNSLCDEFDDKAKYWQRRHQFGTYLVALAALTALLMAVLEIAAVSYQPSEAWLQILESAIDIIFRVKIHAQFTLASLIDAGCSTLAFVAVAGMLLIRLDRRWLGWRFKANQLRQFKFYWLLQARTQLEASETLWRTALQREPSVLLGLNQQSPGKWAEGHLELAQLPTPDWGRLNSQVINDLVPYYIAKRLNWQLNYFESQVKARGRWELITKWLVWIAFFASLSIAMGVFLVETFHIGHEDPHDNTPTVVKLDPWVAKCLIVVISLPILGSMIRTLRTASEFGRNAERFSIVAHHLTKLRGKLEKSGDAREQLELMHEAEGVLDDEQRHWILLMSEAEWFG